jgi:hypothetical protein
MAITLTELQRLLLGIVSSVESGVTTPAEAANELANLKARAVSAGLKFHADYTEDDFQKIRENYVSMYETSTPYVEESYEQSYESSY